MAAAKLSRMKPVNMQQSESDLLNDSYELIASNKTQRSDLSRKVQLNGKIVNPDAAYKKRMKVIEQVEKIKS